MRQYRRTWYEKNRAQAINKTKQRRQAIVAWMREYKSQLSCTSCPESHPACLDFHHLDPSTKDFSIGVSARGMSLTKIKEEIAKCVVLCSNCHRKIHYAGIV